MEPAWGRSWAGSVVPAIWIPRAADATLGCMTAEPIDTSTHRLDLLAHLAVCSPCAALFAFARDHQDLDALDAWRRQLAAHLAADRERRDYDHEVLGRLAAYRKARRADEVP